MFAKKAKNFIAKLTGKKEPLAHDQMQPTFGEPEQPQGLATPAAESITPQSVKPSIADYIAGEVSDFKDELTPYLPIELIAGEVPYVVGMEVEAVWNAASQACATEKVHFSYTVDLAEEKVTYIACPSSTLTSAPDSWCPLVAALPGNPEFIDKQTVYVYEQDASTAALRWNDETGRVQLFIGGSRTILPKIQSMDTNFVTIGKDNPHVIPWRNIQLRTEKLARALTRTLLFSGLGIVLILITVLLIDMVSLTFSQNDLSDVELKTQQATNKLIENSYKAMHSDIITHNARIQELLSDLSDISGTLVKYEINKSAVTWEALVPAQDLNSIRNQFRNVEIIDDNQAGPTRMRIRGKS